MKDKKTTTSPIPVSVHEFLQYNMWVGTFSAISAVAARLDTFLTARYLGPYDIGIYAAANQLVQIIPQFIGALGTVVAPKFANMGSAGELIRYIHKLYLLIAGIAVGGIILLPLVYYFVPLVLGEQYTASLPIFGILFVAMMIFLVSIPVHNAIIYYFSYPKLFFPLSIVYAVIVFINGIYFIPLYGSIGAARGVLIAQVVNFLVPLLWLEKRLRKEKTSLFNFSR